MTTTTPTRTTLDMSVDHTGVLRYHIDGVTIDANIGTGEIVGFNIGTGWHVTIGSRCEYRARFDIVRDIVGDGETFVTLAPVAGCYFDGGTWWDIVVTDSDGLGRGPTIHHRRTR